MAYLTPDSPGLTTSEALGVQRTVRQLANVQTDASDTPDNPGLFWRLINLNPAIWRGIIVSVLALLATFGLVVSDKGSEAIVTAIFAIVALLQAISTHGAVTANQKVVVYKPDPIDKPSVVASGDAISTDVVAVANAAAAPNNLPFPGTIKG